MPRLYQILPLCQKSRRGFRRQNNIDEVRETDKATVSKGWKATTYSSLVLTVALVIFNIIRMDVKMRSRDI